MQILMLRKMQSGLTLSVQEMLQIGPFAQWTMDCKLSLCPGNSDQSKTTNQHSSGEATLAVGLSDNAVQMHKLLMVEAEMVGQVQVPYPFLLCAWQRHATSAVRLCCNVQDPISFACKGQSVRNCPMPTIENHPHASH